MAVIALKEGYEFPSRSRKELYGDDQLVHVMWRNNRRFCAAATFRAPTAIPFGDFLAGIVEPWAGSDPSFVPGSFSSWTLDGQPLEVDLGRTLGDHGVGHKSLLTFEA